MCNIGMNVHWTLLSNYSDEDCHHWTDTRAALINAGLTGNVFRGDDAILDGGLLATNGCSLAGTTMHANWGFLF